MQKQVLGRGLDAIFKTPSAETVQTIAINKIKPNKYQPRKKFTTEQLEELAASIKEHGLIQPILIAETLVPGEYELIAGERRLRASKLAGKAEIKAIVRRNITDKNRADWALIENIQRQDITPIEEARAYKRLVEEFKHTHDEIGAIVGKNRAVITNSMRLLSLPEDIQDLIDEGKISSGHGRVLAGLEGEAEIKRALKMILDEGISVNALERFVSETKPVKKSKPKKKPEIELENLKDELQRKFSTKANVSGTSKKGKIEIFYFSLEDLERIIKQLNIKA
jgi:ParB family chromosome partitioning protein